MGAAARPSAGQLVAEIADVVPQRGLTVESLAAALAHAVRDHTIQAAAELGARIRTGHGVAAAVHELEVLVAAGTSR